MQGQSGCKQCEPGKYTTTSNAANSGCISCVVNYYVGTSQATGCLQCPAGKATGHTAKLTANAACTDCLPGYYKKQADGANCVACEPGKYQTAAGQTFCTSCDAGLYSGVTAATTASVCLQCKPGNFSVSSSPSCGICIAGKYTNVVAASTCTMCVGEQAYAPYTGMTTCFQCVDKRQISDIKKTFCFSCNDGEEEDRPNSVCVKCAIGKYSDGTTNRKCVDCRAGTYATSVGTSVCEKCKACPDSFYRSGCTITQGGGTCVECAKCVDSTEVLVDCMNRAGHNNAQGICRKREFTVRNPFCDLQGSGYFLGGYPFNELFGTSQDNADFQCRGICDGVTNRLTDEMKKEASLSKYRNESFDSGYCKGPYACDVPTCVIYGVYDDSQPAYRLPAACPVVINEDVSSQLWGVTKQANYKQHPVTIAVQHMRYSVQCQACSTCGEVTKDILKVWPMMQNYTDWGRGCARECTELSCPYGEIFDWTVTDITRKCRKCVDLEDVRLCTSQQQKSFAASDISGNLPKLTFKNCQPRRIVQYGIARATYGDCLRCPESSDACVGQPGLYYATCDADLNPVCKKCDSRSTAFSSYFNGTHSTPLYCQKTLCSEGQTGVNVDVFPHSTCKRKCSKIKCASDQVELPCLLPHDKRCRTAISYTNFPLDEMYKKRSFVPAHANVLEMIQGLHLFSSFENVLLSLQSLPVQKRRVCVWNADGITDNDMNPAGVSINFQAECRPWIRDPYTSYPLLPMQNTVTEATEFQRRILLNTSAIAMHYSSQWQNVQRIPNVFTGDVFLDLKLTNTSHTAMVAFVSADRLLSNVTSVVRWHVSVYAQQTVGQTNDVMLSIDTHDDVQNCDACFQLELSCSPPNCTRLTPTSNRSNECSSAPHSTFRTAPLTTAWQDFCGDKFHINVSSGKIYACDQSMQKRFVPKYTSGHVALSILSGKLDTSCAEESLFSVALTTSHVMIGGTEALADKCCLAFVFSNTSVFCVSTQGQLHTISDSRLHTDAFTIQNVVVYRDNLIITVSSILNKVTTSYVQNISMMCSGTQVQAQVLNANAKVLNHTRDPIFMLATGNPNYFLSMVDAQTETTMMLRQFTCGDVLMMFYTFCESDLLPVRLFTGNLPAVEFQNTLLEARKEMLLFATSTNSPSAGTVLTIVLIASQNVTRSSVALTTEARDIVYPNNGQAHPISGYWMSDDYYILGLLDQEQIWKITLGPSFLYELVHSTDTMFSYSFIAVGGSLLTKTVTGYSFTTCMLGCKLGTKDKDAYFAFGSDTLTYKRMLPCRDSRLTHVNQLDLQQTPTETCAVAEFNRSTYAMEYALAAKCKQPSGVISMSLLLQVGAVMRITGSNALKTLTAGERQLMSIYAHCVSMNVQYIELFDHFACSAGCTYHQPIQMRFTGNMHVNYVLHTSQRPSNSMIYTQLHSSTYALSVPQKHTSFDSWTQHSALTHTMHDLQRIQVNMLRQTKAVLALSEEANVALDVLQVVPTLNLQGMLYQLPNNETVLLSLVHIPSQEDIAALGLLDSIVRGNEISGWKRMHATAFIRLTTMTLVDCTYDLRIVAVTDKFALRQTSSYIGCRMRLTTEGLKAIGQCHIELPFAMANSAGILGLLVSAGTCGLPPAHSVTVEINPFTSMSECPEHQYLVAENGKCAACEMQEVACGVGFYAAGCEAMLFQSNLVQCLPCPVPRNARFTNASRTCSDWLCEESFFRSGSTCMNCTTALKSICARTKGQMWMSCSGVENEKCMDCPLSLLPRNAEWTNSSQCAWKCQSSYFNNNGICESCLSLKILRSVLGIQGTRTPGQFYKFQPCTATRQAEFTPCQFQQRLNVTYTADAIDFLQDCPVRCAEYLHDVKTTVLDSKNTTWQATQCIACPLSTQPRYVNGTLVPRSGYDMDAACAATCSASSEHYAVAINDNRCAYCPAGRCTRGQYSTTTDGCVACLNCTSNLLGAFIFEREGSVNENASCLEVCAPGYYLADDGLNCLPHTDVKCVSGQFKINGTARTDARCDDCTDCTGYKQIRACSVTQDAVCESCGPLVWWSSFWNGTQCDLACKTAYTKVYYPKTRCQRCSACPNGYERVAKPANCSDCTVCIPPKPKNAEYISQCAWKCEKFHILQLNEANSFPECVYSVDWSTNAADVPPRRQYNFSCAVGQTLTSDLLCAACATPPGLNQSDVQKAWTWTGVDCTWQCMPGLMHVANNSANQSYCLTRSAYLALLARRITQKPVAAHVLHYNIFLVVVIPIAFALVTCCILPKKST